MLELAKWAWMQLRANSSISAMRPPCYSLLEEIVARGVTYGSLVWMVCNPAAPAGPRGIRGLSPATGAESRCCCFFFLAPQRVYVVAWLMHNNTRTEGVTTMGVTHPKGPYTMCGARSASAAHARVKDPVMVMAVGSSMMGRVYGSLQVLVCHVHAPMRHNHTRARQ